MYTDSPIIEICANSFESALAAMEGGADRVELCSVLQVGGVTPSYGMIKSCKNELRNIEINVLIRPRYGDFCYNRYEVEEIKQDITLCADLGVNGVVIGALTPEGEVDMELCEELIELARSYNLSVTFHRAIDRAANIYRALDDIIKLGVDRVLTSGGEQSAIEGAITLFEMVIQAAGRVNIMAGSGITPKNVRRLVQESGVPEVHLSATSYRTSKAQHQNGPFFAPSALGGESIRTFTDSKIVREVVRLLRP